MRVEKWEGKQRGMQAGEQGVGKWASKGEGNWAVIFYEIIFFIIFEEWKIDVFPYNFLINQNRKLRKVAIERKFQELSKPLTFSENW